MIINFIKNIIIITFIIISNSVMLLLKEVDM